MKPLLAQVLRGFVGIPLELHKSIVANSTCFCRIVATDHNAAGGVDTGVPGCLRIVLPLPPWPHHRQPGVGTIADMQTAACPCHPASPSARRRLYRRPANCRMSAPPGGRGATLCRTDRPCGDAGIRGRASGSNLGRVRVGRTSLDSAHPSGFVKRA